MPDNKSHHGLLGNTAHWAAAVRAVESQRENSLAGIYLFTHQPCPICPTNGW